MKRLLAILFFFNSFAAFCQHEKVVDLMVEQEFVLDGNMSRKGQSRIVIPIDNVPAHTSEISYCVETNKKGKRKVTAEDAAGILAKGEPRGDAMENRRRTQPISVYLLPGDNDARLFLANSDSVWNHYPDLENEHCMNCKIYVPWPLEGGPHPLIGIENPLPDRKIKVVVSIAAIISK